MLMSENLPGTITSEEELDALLARPYPETIDLMRRLDGDIMILGVGGKMGPSLARLAAEACRAAGVRKRVIGVARFSDPAQREWLERHGVETLRCDLARAEDVAALPQIRNILFLAGRKFGAVGSEAETWIQNVIVPANVAQTFRSSRIVAFSTGCVYPLLPSGGRGSCEVDLPAPVGEYANSCLGRERVFQYYSSTHGIPVLLYRLNYAIDLRYGVLADIAQKVAAGEPVDVTVGSANVIWQGDANNRALLSLELAGSPAVPLNITGPETLSTREIAHEFGRLLNRPVTITGQEGEKCYLSDASRSIELWGAPKVSLPQLMRWTAEWIQRGGRNLGKPTHFTVTDGQFLDETRSEEAVR